jgi:hypothetical protein
MARTCTENYCTSSLQRYTTARPFNLYMQASVEEVSLSPMARGPYYGAGLVGLVKSHMGLHLTCIEQQASLQACPQTTFFVGV